MNEMLALITLNHNSALLKRSENILNSFLEDENVSLYLKNPDGTSIKLKHGCGFIFMQSLNIKEGG